MKVTYEFIDQVGHDKDESDRRQAFECGSNMHSVLWDYLQFLRSEMKHGNHSDPVYETLEMCREKIWGLISDEGIENLFG